MIHRVRAIISLNSFNRLNTVVETGCFFFAIGTEFLSSIYRKRRSTIILHGSITQKTALNIILAAVRT
jgi:hypothetical protein